MPGPTPRSLFRMTWGVLALYALLVSPIVLKAQAGEYLDHAALTTELQTLVDRSARGSLTSIGRSLEGREIWMVEMPGPGSTPLATRPGILVVANLEADQLVGSGIVLELLRHLVTEGGEDDPAWTDRILYMLPRLNPDGAEGALGSPRADGSGNRRPIDDDNDGRVDEDPAEDLNGDGFITLMRVPDPLGRYGILAADPRRMIEADPAAELSGTHTIYWEGVDSDGDGFLNEDGLGGVDLDRNFQHDYPYYTAGAGPHMVSEAETRALMDFMVSHRNVAAVLTLGRSDNLVTPPRDNGSLAPASPLELPAFADASFDEIFTTGIYGAGTAGGIQLRGAQVGADNDAQSGQRPAMIVHEDDLPYFQAASEAYRELTGIERLGVTRDPRGAFFQYGYFHFGVPSFSTPGWALPEVAEEEEEAGEPAPGFEGELLGALAGADPFLPWTPFDHPELGPVEIGGFRPGVATNPPPEMLPTLGRAHAAFLLRLATLLPRIAIVDTEVESHGGGLFTIAVTVENSGFFPTALRQGVIAGSVDPLTVQIDVPTEQLLTGDPKTSQLPSLEGSGSRVRYEWVIRGESGSSVLIRARSAKGGTVETTVQLEGE